MGKVFKIGLVYINTTNLGDIVIFDCTKYLIEESLKAIGVKNYEIVPIDMGDKIAAKYRVPKSFIKSQKQKYSNANEYTQKWKRSKAYYFFKENEVSKVDSSDMIIFAGGGLIKFHQQQFHYYIDEITRIAEANRIPVIFNAVGVEGFKKDDVRCQILKNALNRRCVKAIAARDSLEILNKKYLLQEKATLVCDPALWVSEAYNIEKKKSDLVGVGVIRPEIFVLYGHKISRESLTAFFVGIVEELEKRRIKYQLFSNGGARDHDYIQEIINKAGNKLKSKQAKRSYDGEELVRNISSYSRIITCRMHGAVIASSLGIPVLSVVWNNKQIKFAKLIGQPNSLIDTHDTRQPTSVVERLLEAKEPSILTDYKNTDKQFIMRYVKKYYRQRYFVKAYRFYKFNGNKVRKKFQHNRDSLV